jgi:hypothetical protein
MLRFPREFARDHKGAVDTIVRDTSLSTKAVTPLKDDRPHSTRTRQYVVLYATGSQSLSLRA